MLGSGPGGRHLGRRAAGIASTAHALHDPLGEEHPDLLVVVELRMPLEPGDCGAARLVVAPRVELEAIAEAKSLVALRPEIGARPGEREVDVEDDRAQCRCHRARIACGEWRGRTTRAGPARRDARGVASRDFRLLWGGQTISFVGDAAFVIAVGWRVTALTNSAGSLGFVLAAESVAMLATLLWGGVLADRYPRSLLMIASDLARAVVVAVFFVVEVTGT